MNQSNGTVSPDLQSYAIDPNALAYVEALYEQYREDHDSVPKDWIPLFEQRESAEGTPYVSHRALQTEITRRARWKQATPQGGTVQGNLPKMDSSWMAKQAAVLRLIQAYRILGHVRAKTDPINLRVQPNVRDLDPYALGLEEGDMDVEFNTGNLVAPDYMKLRDIVTMLRETYTGSIGFEYMFISDADQKDWLMRRIEGTRGKEDLSVEDKKRILSLLVSSEGMEKYLHVKFSGKKRFSLEGGESFIPLIHEAIQRAGAQGVDEVVIGMAHRGRLNLLTNIMGKSPTALFREFGDHVHGMDDKMTGDVKYHQGFSSDVQTPGGIVHLALAFNPSHLEIINPVICGSARARMDRAGDSSLRRVLPLLVHGDAALAGQGVVYETAQLAATRGYSTGGVLHVVINNQIGFTTSHPLDSRSSLYCTDVGKVNNCPIFHVNGDDPEAVIWAVRTAVDFRMKFKKDVYIDLMCFRRHGHNEGDEPSVTQPMMYRVIRKHPGTPSLYAKRLQDSGVIDKDTPKQMANTYRDALDEGEQVAPNIVPRDLHTKYYTAWRPYLNGKWKDKADTAVSARKLKKLGAEACAVPDGFSMFPGLRKLIDDRLNMVEGKQPMDWGCAETLAYATLIDEGFRVRISGQDSARGTFFHRHAALHDYNTGRKHIPLAKMASDRGTMFNVFDSILSEEAVLGFEYGYSMTEPGTLVIWEAQYGDFANGAQVLIDQFISSSQQKWNLYSGLVMMLPHGWEGQGPEHSSARLERFLQLCAQENMQVIVPSTAAQMFHALRRQLVRKLRIPLIIMSPKSMLRRKDSFSSLEDLSKGRFMQIIPEVDESIEADRVTRVVLCSGKMYYELAAKRKERELRNVVIIRIEQLYPFDDDGLREQLGRYQNLRDVVWAQEEPVNQGAWYQIQHRLHQCIKSHHTLTFAGRIACSAPAGGSPRRHAERETILIHQALDLEVPEFE
ncbi:MAG: 2-oxoglutarate dehydrogenase E1 component [Verrucomicrobia bacterium]|nr:2-oxoglutarate dehydrogenase E1 component [Verrucomicrobiota bacterium]MCH8510138.1 2-oxoglutarate dehydrogenase E1 component [Kiritimatiellia bacterium]